MEYPYTILGYLVSVILGHPCIAPVVKRFHKTKATGNPDLTTAAVGCIERGLYTTAWLLHQPAFIGLWLALKVAGKWELWQKDRRRYNVFLLGSGMSIFFGATGGLLPQWLTNRQGMLALAVIVVLVMVSIVLYAFAWNEAHVTA